MQQPLLSDTIFKCLICSICLMRFQLTWAFMACEASGSKFLVTILTRNLGGVSSCARFGFGSHITQLWRAESTTIVGVERTILSRWSPWSIYLYQGSRHQVSYKIVRVGPFCQALMMPVTYITSRLPDKAPGKFPTITVEYGVTANITAFHAVARGSIPRTRTKESLLPAYFICPRGLFTTNPTTTYNS